MKKTSVMEDFLKNERQIEEFVVQVEVEKEVSQGKREALYQTNSAQAKFDDEFKKQSDKTVILQSENQSLTK